MKCVMIFLVLSLVLLMAEPGEGFIRSFFRGAKTAFRGARDNLRDQRRQEKLARYDISTRCLSPALSQ
uniref:Uncharacterized protein n=1 Tax=Fundulus heteroclitus TaxID=8078 RepID=A0A3Q2PIE6_FUNHE